jgi:hypothetical protein
LLRAFINPSNADSNSLKDTPDTRNQSGLKPSHSESLADNKSNNLQATAQQKNPSAFQSFSTDKLTSKVGKVKTALIEPIETRQKKPQLIKKGMEPSPMARMLATKNTIH